MMAELRSLSVWRYLLRRVERRGAGGTARAMAGSGVRPKARAHEVEGLGEGEGGGGSEGFSSRQHARS